MKQDKNRVYGIIETVESHSPFASYLHSIQCKKLKKDIQDINLISRKKL